MSVDFIESSATGCAKRWRRRFAWVCSACLLGVALPRHAARADSVIGLAGGLYIENSTLHGEQRVSVQKSDQSFDYNPTGKAAVTTWFLVPITERLRLGPGFRYAGTYTAERDGNDGNFEFGQLLEMYAQAEYLVPVSETIEGIFGARAGGSMLFPGGDFQREIDRLREQGASVWSVPRLGILAGPFVGARWRVHNRLWLRSDLGLKLSRLFLFSTEEDVSGISFKKSWHANSIRYEFNIGVELAL